MKTGRKPKAPLDRKGTLLSVRLDSETMESLRYACYRDLMKPCSFAQEAISKALEKLIQHQKTHGYQCKL